MKKYDNYKFSGIEWIGDIPEQWDILKLNFIADVYGGSTPSSSKDEYWDGDINWVTTDDLGKLNTKRITNSKRKITLEGLRNCSASLVPKDSIILSSRAPIGYVGILDIEACTNQGCKSIVINKNANSDYLYYFLLSAKDDLQSLGSGSTFTEISATAVKNYKVSLPSLLEQTTIAAFLDHKTAQIDALIEKKEQLIDMLKEQRQAIINEAVTKGLKPNAPMKDSGIEWLGEIPEHWEVVKLKHLFEITGGGTPNKQVDNFWNGTIPWVSPKDMKVDLITTTEDLITGEGLANSTTNLIDEGNLLMVVRSGILQRTIPIAITGTPVAVNQDIKAFTSRGRVSSNYLFYFVKGNELNLLNEIVKQGATVESVELDFLTNTSIVFPSIAEQNRIVDYLDEKEQIAEQVTNKLRLSIEKLKLYRQSLISEVVTGKIDVRDWKKPDNN